ncbi:MAG TPA: MFS transporter [Alphaproteobacteria bacterium]
MSLPPGGPGSPKTSRRALVAWCLYDWANSAFAAVVLTFVFAAYFTQGVAKDEVVATSQWGYALTLSAIAIAILSPIFGAVADQGGRRKPWLAFFSLLCIAASASLWFVKPDPSYALMALVGVAIANLAFEFGVVFYNAMLNDLVPEDRLGRLSGWGWGLGYAGGLVCLVIVLMGFVSNPEPWFGLGREQAAHVRIAAPIAALWFAAFAWPIFVFTPDHAATGLSWGEAIRRGLRTLGKTLRDLPKYRNVARYLIAQMIYTDGLNTLFAFGGIYAAGQFGMKVEEVIWFGIALNLTAGLGAAAFAWIDDWIGAKRTVLIALAGLTAVGAAILLTEDKTVFWGLGLALGIFFGPAQAASRSLMARLAPAEMQAEMFGLYALTGKATAFIGPALFGFATSYYGTQRAGMATVLTFFLVGGAILWFVKEPKRAQ